MVLKPRFGLELYKEVKVISTTNICSYTQIFIAFFWKPYMGCYGTGRSKLSNSGSPDFIAAVQSNIMIKLPLCRLMGIEGIAPLFLKLCTTWR
jgi:hypothetical protein